MYIMVVCNEVGEGVRVREGRQEEREGVGGERWGREKGEGERKGEK